MKAGAMASWPSPRGLQSEDSVLEDTIGKSVDKSGVAQALKAARASLVESNSRPLTPNIRSLVSTPRLELQVVRDSFGRPEITPRSKKPSRLESIRSCKSIAEDLAETDLEIVSCTRPIETLELGRSDVQLDGRVCDSPDMLD
eukprot:TRINITY_DN6570_c0_g2_i1.p1 TRINITY_DN6570_c0_g2~~TRINITY_DN6570_c0_g2_i1.p1  ORF type:complete len:143 (-),score=25.45 TRINITY_DN6570_c0_g2_i1:191-619(-)